MSRAPVRGLKEFPQTGGLSMRERNELPSWLPGQSIMPAGQTTKGNQHISHSKQTRFNQLNELSVRSDLGSENGQSAGSKGDTGEVPLTLVTIFKARLGGVRRREEGLLHQGEPVASFYAL